MLPNIPFSIVPEELEEGAVASTLPLVCWDSALTALGSPVEPKKKKKKIQTPGSLP